MSDLQRYILEEWAEDYRSGRLRRREFLRRTAILAGGTAVAVAVLRSLGVVASAEEVAAAAAGQAGAPSGPSGVTVPESDAALQAEAVAFSSGGTRLLGYLARPRADGPAPGVVVIHENRGLLEHFRDICRRLARLGYVAVAVDLASHQGGTARYSDPAQVTAILGQTPPEQLVAMADGYVRYLQGLPFVRGDRIGTVGYCFGGGMVWRLATASAELKAAVPYYGPAPPLQDVPKIRAAVLAIYGERDTRINAGIPALREALERARVVHEIVIYPDADHAFFNDTGARYHPQAARAAWERTVAWFDRYLRG